MIFQHKDTTWEQRKFTDITFLSGEKNKDNLPYESYSVTNENGFVPQNEQFENGGTMATADKRMYYIVSKNVRVRRKSPKSVSRKQPILVKRKSP